ncbi:MAG: dihydroorotase [Acidobacteria bacterium 13_1_20CM_2_55_15]|nr:MAG: dihydroorotase [Acidobacteria bacterium 13_1_40CM_56_16]OLD67563.1 MAG: dihydroorotase [Acidobacteria bacterium 13_1_40CM_2_56_11]OLE87849.1 MAG: dihydroorotase [Acidobacteria bacterium 13_1_20CM_2_55_15]
MDLVVKNGRLVDPARKVDAVADIVIRSGKIQSIGSATVPEIPVFDATGLIVAPGFFDIHVHLREPGTEEAETIATGGSAAVAGGFTAVAAMPNTKPPNDDPSITHYIISEARRSSPARVFPIGAITKEQKGETLAEIGEMFEAGIVGISDDGKPVMDARLFRRALEYAGMFDMPVIQHCEDLHLAKDGVMHEGVYSTRLGLKGIPAAAEETMVSRDLILAEMTGSKYHVAHLSTRRSLERVREAKSRGLRVTAEVTPHHFTLTDSAVADYDTNAKMNPPLRSSDDLAAIVEGISDGTIDAIASDHAPHHVNVKMLEFDRAAFGITGLETAVGLALTKLPLSITRLIELFSINPQKIMKVVPWGLFEGSDADLTILDLNRTWTFDVNQSRSRSRNSPFYGWPMKGKAVGTIVGGKVVFQDRT